MTQGELAKASGVSENTIGAFESGERVPRRATLDALKDAFERRGIEFSNGDEPGVKLRRSRAVIPAP
jgi:transcriptional regulator with XRE-family HTH domain